MFETDIDPSGWDEHVAVLMDFEAAHRSLIERGVEVSSHPAQVTDR